jgi:hypothetical protein
MAHLKAKRFVLWVVVTAVSAGAIWLGLAARETSIPRSALAMSTPTRHPIPAFRPAASASGSPAGAPSPAMSAAQLATAPPRFQTRAPGEWDGMQINLNVTPPCDTSAICGLARACVGGVCSGCKRDDDCVRGENCVLDHCVKNELIECRGTKDCTAGVCILSGYSSTPRGNDGMKAYCVDNAGGSQPPPAPVGPPIKDTRPSLPDDDLMKAAREAT